MPAQQPTVRQTASVRATNGTTATKRARGQPAATPASTVDDASSRPEFVHPPSTSHPSLPAPFSHNARNANSVRTSAVEWPAGQLEGPGMPVARSFPSTPPVPVPEPENETAPAPVEADPDGDDTTLYCFCHRASFGEMIACDGQGCEVEWVRRYVSISQARFSCAHTVPSRMCWPQIPADGPMVLRGMPQEDEC